MVMNVRWKIIFSRSRRLNLRLTLWDDFQMSLARVELGQVKC